MAPQARSTGVRDGGDCLAAGAGNGAAAAARAVRPQTLRQRAWAAAPAARLPGGPNCLRREPSPVQRSPWVDPAPMPEPGQGRAARRAEGVPFTDSEETPHRSGDLELLD